MKSAMLMLLLAATLVPHERLAQTTGTPSAPAMHSIEVIVRTSAGRAIEDVDVVLTGTSLATSHMTNRQTTDGDGKVVFRNLAPGAYQVRADRPGYFWILPGSNPAAVATVNTQVADRPEPDTKRFTLTIIPGGVVAGRVQTPTGRPISGLRITAMQLLYPNGRQSFGQISAIPSGGAQTDDLGEYRIFWLPPGTYYLRTENWGALRPSTAAVDYIAPTYYPGTTQSGSAAAVTLSEGQEAGGINFVVQPPGRIRVSGKLVFPIPATAPPNARAVTPSFSLSLMPLAGGPAEPLQNFPIFGNSGAGATEFPFAILGVPPGPYELIASGTLDNAGARNVFSGRTRIEVGDSDVAAVTVTVARTVEIHGRVSVQGSSPGPSSQASRSFRVQFQVKENVPGPGFSSLTATTSEDGTFTIPSAPQLQYQLASITGIPPDAYLADIRQNGRSIYNEGALMIGNETIDLELFINRNGGTIQGTMSIPRRGDDVVTASLVLVPDMPRRGNIVLYRRANAALAPPAGAAAGSVTGKFSFQGIAPGNYKLLAFEELPPGSPEMNSDYFALHEQRGVAVKVTEGVTVSDIHPPFIPSR